MNAPPVPDHDLRFLKARDTMLSGSARGTTLPNGEPITGEACLILTIGAGETIAVEGSYRRLLKWLEYGRDRLLAAAPLLEHVTGFPEGEDPKDYDDVELHGLRCPHPDCGAITWDGWEDGIRIIDFGERQSSWGYRYHPAGDWHGKPQPELHVLVGSYGDSPDMETDRYECETCGRPVNLPDDVEEDPR